MNRAAALAKARAWLRDGPWSVLLWTLAAFALWAVRFRLPIPAADAELDGSWQQALGLAIVRGFAFGDELTFTFGPLGALQIGRFQPELWWAKVALWSLAFKGLLSLRLAAAVRASNGRVAQVALLAVLLLLGATDDAWFLFAIAALALRHWTSERSTWPAIVVDLALLATIGLIKFPYLLLAACAALLIAITEALRAPRRGALVVALALGSLAALWLALGQSLANLPSYFARSWTIASRYPEGQSAEGPAIEVAIAIACLALLGVQAWARWRGKRVAIAVVPAAVFLAAAGMLFFRAGFTIQNDRAPTFFVMAAALALVVGPPADGTAASSRTFWAAGIARWAGFALALLGFALHDERPGGRLAWIARYEIARVPREVAGLAHLSALRADLERQREATKLVRAMPRVREAVGKGTIDLLGNDLATLFLNELAWRPRPILQPYLALSPELARLEESFLLGSRAPEFVLMRPETIDDRVPGLEDSLALRALWRAWDPVLEEKGAILFRRREGPMRPAEGTVLVHKTIHFDERVDVEALEGRCLWMRLDVRPTLLGRARAALLRAPRVALDVEFDARTTIRYRAPIGMLATGFSLRPLLSGTPDWVAIYLRGASFGPRAFTLRGEIGPSPWFEPEAELTIERCDELLPAAAPELARELVFSSWSWRPARATGGMPAWPQLTQGQELVMVGETSRLVFAIPATGGHVRARYGILADGDRAPAGVAFVAKLIDAAGVETELWRRELRPRTDGGPTTPTGRVNLDLAPGEQQRFVLETASLEERNRFALAFWSQVAIE